MSERINTSSEAIYFYRASIILVEVEQVSTSGLCLSPGERWSDMFSLDVSAWKRNVLTGDQYFIVASWEQMRVFSVCF